eukprot:Seg803.10 transcript_id=Seg803.10/GoldUCD/mRNA.D3Y31 product="hypothetical protein" protein_id=Seg803.10/GoldUCD/D3Y31
MFEFVGRCFHGEMDIWGLCSRKAKYVDFGSEERRGKFVNGHQTQDPAWDADVDALTEMEYNLVAEQPKGIKLELHDPDTLESPRDQEEHKHTQEETSVPDDLEKDVKPKATNLDFENHNELSDLIPENESENNSSIDDSS